MQPCIVARCGLGQQRRHVHDYLIPCKLMPEHGVTAQGPLGTWTERETAAVQLQDIALGFRLQLHAPHEYRMLYW